MIAWPDVFPCILVDGYGYKRRDIVLRSEMETGRVRMRQRFADGPTDVQGSLTITRPQLAYFEGWWLHILQAGSQPFLAPISNGLGDAVQHECRFLEPYSVRAIGGQVFRVELQLLAEKLQVYDAATLEVIDAYGSDADDYGELLAALETFVNVTMPGSTMGSP